MGIVGAVSIVSITYHKKLLPNGPLSEGRSLYSPFFRVWAARCVRDLKRS